MKQFLLAALVLLSAHTFSQTNPDTLNNEAIITLTKSKLPETIILKKISQSVCNFDVSVHALVKLKENNVNDRVISAMMNGQSKTAETIATPVSASLPEQNPAFPESGIYFSKDAGFTSLDPATVKLVVPDVYFLTLKYKFRIDGPEANYQIENNRPEFYFVFDTVKKSLNDPNGSTAVPDNSVYIDPVFGNVYYDRRNRFFQAISPNDFRLIKLDLDKPKSSREFSSKTVSAEEQYNIPFEKKYLVGFKYEKISGTTFKIKFDNALPPGQYCFLYSGNTKITDCTNSMKVFDFSIK